MSEIIAQRQFSPMYIYLDTAFLILLAVLLLKQKKYMTVAVGVAAGVLYMIVDYGIFHLLCHTRSISAGHSLFWVLLWMSMSYGFTNFVWIWLWISRDKNLKEWSLLILMWWFCCPMLAATFGGTEELITIQRTTGAYHGYMALILFVGYLGVIIWNLRHQKSEQKIPIGWILAIGILVQFGWEAALLIGGIRSATIVSWGDKLLTLIVNSLLETNLGMPYVYALYILYSSHFTEQITKRHEKLSFLEALEENNTMAGIHR
ncbi:MAG: hypothetical protein J6K58_14655 [Lachnospiraceae bacterium]|nr:hypothetical protein [Lachnospiraceae bacterium]